MDVEASLIKNFTIGERGLYDEGIFEYRFIYD